MSTLLRGLDTAVILAVIDAAITEIPELSGSKIRHQWALAAVAAASEGIVAGLSTHADIAAAARATAAAMFHVKPLSFGNDVVGYLLAHVLLTLNGEEISLAETVELVAAS